MTKLVDIIPVETTIVMFGPVVWEPAKSGDGRNWYFGIIWGPTRGDITRNNCGDDEDLANAARQAMVVELATSGRSLQFHDFEDELKMMLWAEAAWPSSTLMTEIRKGMEAERGVEA